MYNKEQIISIQQATHEWLNEKLQILVTADNVETLRDILRFHEHRYYLENDPLISDYEYDMLYKKSTKKGKKYLPNSRDDETFTKKYLFFENKRFGGLGDIHSRIVDVLEELFIKELTNINPQINLGHICFGLIINHNNTNTQQEIYNRDWKRELPGLSDADTLTAEDKYLMRQISVWYEDILKFQECNLNMLPSHYHKKIDNDREEMERIINE